MVLFTYSVTKQEVSPFLELTYKYIFLAWSKSLSTSIKVAVKFAISALFSGSMMFAKMSPSDHAVLLFCIYKVFGSLLLRHHRGAAQG